MDKILNEHLYIVILCGGSGKRLWPRSRAQSPKQFIKLFGDKTIFQQTVDRAKLFVPVEKIYLITNKDYVDEIEEQSPELPKKNILAEPLGKNTAMAMGFSSMYLHQIDPEAVLVFIPSDQYIDKIEEFQRSINQAVKAASLGKDIVTIGVKPTFPHTGLGYIKAGETLDIIDSPVFKVVNFTEKPELGMATKFIQMGNYYWNVNLYTWKASVALKAFAKYLPEMASELETLRKFIGTSEEKEKIAEVYNRVQEISIDKGISEKADNLILVPAEFEWSDVGDWKVAYDVSPKDKDGNVIIHEKGDGEFVSIDSQNCLVHFSDQLITTIGVKDLVIIDTKDALLIVDRSRAQDVKELVNLLKEKGKDKYL